MGLATEENANLGGRRTSADDSATVPEANKKWKAYTFICIISFVNFVSIADVLGVQNAQEFFILEEQKTVSLMFGIV
jgi:hypothetical protein